ncbi:MAG: HAMP domain-containing sensor histidine kinase [Alphaproteobacteria bacterium]
MTDSFGRRGLLYAVLVAALLFSGFKAIQGLAGLRNTIDLSPDAITGYDGHRAEVEFTRFLDSLAAYEAGVDGIDLDEVTTRFDILWARCHLFINGAAYEAMRQQAGIGEVAKDLLEALKELEDDVFALERGDLETLKRLRQRLTPFEPMLTSMTTRVADLEVATRDEVREAIHRGLATLDHLALTVGIVVVVLLSLFGFEAIYARRAERQLAGYQEHLEQLVAERTDALQRQTIRLEEALERERELTDIQRQFVSMVSHEFRTPLGIIDGSMQRLKRRIDQLTKDKILSSCDQIQRAVKRLVHLMESTLSASRLEAGSIAITVQDCDIRSLLEDVCEDQRSMTRTHQIVTDLELLPSSIRADEALLRQTFSNLLSNAVKYSPEGKYVWVEARVDDGNALITVRDQGVGIPDDELPRLFERFFRASTSTGIPGTGIGLNFVRHLVDMHHGTLSVSTKAGKGSAFTVSLPIDGPKASADQEEAGNTKAA